MSRITVAAYLMVVTAAGPWACCCTATRLSALLRHATTSRSHSAPPSRACCGHHGHPGGTSKDRQAPERPRCPCREQSFGSAEALRPTAEAADQLQHRHLSSVPFGIPELLTAGPRPPHSEGALDRPGLSALPFLTTDDLLRALHILRC